ncbi:uncharacterized protein PITG_03062 [Phytophthora infestans T30-4]|uniref:Uncharacterized protein n=1 Tax=Phytophthora infestans (strain T30-4) TaxID=403677 RepID=D0MZA1_PHYIT|nr:uncharacterized protein PITG_03062 [Phytophthora infestans T30-4]EEY65564.1 conserved hypothetical protein [Phytophthora infestans T30-4]|eukprot:XP_002906163.1 conserved hypothetical protein [Phytophthora infestans T30-4]
MVMLHIAQLLKAAQELKASIDCMLARSYEQLQSPNMAHFWWKKWNMLPSNDRGDPTKPDARCWDAMADRLFDAELYVFAADFYAQALAADVEKQIEPSNRFRYRYLLSLLAFSRIPTRTAFRGKVSALSSTSQSPTRKPRTSDRNLQNVKRTKPARRTGSSNNASSAEENQQFQGDQKVSLIEERCENVKLTASAKKSSEFDELSPMKRRTSVVKRLRVKRAERPASAGVEKISSDEEQTLTQSSSTSLLDIYPLNLPRADNFIATCGREPGFADLDLNEVGEFARLAHYRARVLTGKHAAVKNLDTTEVKPQWLQDVERAAAFIKTHWQRNLVSGKVVVEGDSAAHLSEVHTRLVLMITNLCRQYTRDHGETSFTRRLRVVARKLIEWKFTRISEVIAALNDAKTVAIHEEKQRNLEFYHVHRG